MNNSEQNKTEKKLKHLEITLAFQWYCNPKIKEILLNRKVVNGKIDIKAPVNVFSFFYQNALHKKFIN